MNETKKMSEMIKMVAPMLLGYVKPKGVGHVNHEGS